MLLQPRTKLFMRSVHMHRQIHKCMRCLLLTLLIALTGCASQLIDRSRFDRLTARHGLGHVYYTGSKGDHHYFASKYLGEPTSYYRLPASSLALTNTFPKTCDPDHWISWQVSLAAGTEGFPGQYMQQLRK